MVLCCEAFFLFDLFDRPCVCVCVARESCYVLDSRPGGRGAGVACSGGGPAVGMRAVGGALKACLKLESNYMVRAEINYN